MFQSGVWLQESSEQNAYKLLSGEHGEQQGALINNSKPSAYGTPGCTSRNPSYGLWLTAFEGRANGNRNLIQLDFHELIWFYYSSLIITGIDQGFDLFFILFYLGNLVNRKSFSFCRKRTPLRRATFQTAWPSSDQPCQNWCVPPRRVASSALQKRRGRSSTESFHAPPPVMRLCQFLQKKRWPWRRRMRKVVRNFVRFLKGRKRGWLSHNLFIFLLHEPRCDDALRFLPGVGSAAALETVDLCIFHT